MPDNSVSVLRSGGRYYLVDSYGTRIFEYTRSPSRALSTTRVKFTGAVQSERILLGSNKSIQGGWHGDNTRIKILPRDFTADDGAGRPVQIEDGTPGTRRVMSHSTAPMYASISIPSGYTATKIKIFGSAARGVVVYEADIDKATVTSKATGSVGTEINLGTSYIKSTSTNNILIEVASTGSDYVYGGYVTIK